MMVFDGSFYKVVLFSTSGLGASLCGFFGLTNMKWRRSEVDFHGSNGFGGRYAVVDLSSNCCYG